MISAAVWEALSGRCVKSSLEESKTRHGQPVRDLVHLFSGGKLVACTRWAKYRRCRESGSGYTLERERIT